MRKFFNREEKSRRFYTVKEAAKILGLSTNTVYKYLDDGVIEGKRYGGRGRFKIPRSEVASYLADEAPSKTAEEAQLVRKPADESSAFGLLSRVVLGLGLVYILWNFGLVFLNLTKPPLLTDIAASTWNYSDRTFSGFANLAQGITPKLASHALAISRLVSSKPMPEKEAPTIAKEIPEEKVDMTKLVLVKVPEGSSINIREEASSSSAIIAKLETSETANKVAEEGDWTQVAIAQFPVGWVSNRFIETSPHEISQVLSATDEFTGKKIIVNETPTGWLRVRNAPNGAEIGKVYPGESYAVLDKSGNWLLIEGEEGKSLSAAMQGWVSSDFVTIF